MSVGEKAIVRQCSFSLHDRTVKIRHPPRPSDIYSRFTQQTDLEPLHDAGVQLGSACLPTLGASAFERRRRVSRSIVLLDSRIRDVARRLTDEMYAAWNEFRN